MIDFWFVTAWDIIYGVQQLGYELILTTVMSQVYYYFTRDMTFSNQHNTTHQVYNYILHLLRTNYKPRAVYNIN